MLIYILFLIFVSLTIYNYKKCNKDILEPSVIFSAIYTFSIFCALINVKKWNINLSWQTFLILTLGGLEFIIISNKVKDYFDKHKPLNLKEKKTKTINIEKWKIYFIIIYSVIYIGILIYNVFAIASSFGKVTSIQTALGLYRRNTSYNNNASLPWIISQMSKPVLAASYICLFVFIKNIINKKGKWLSKIKKEAIYLLPVLVYIFECLLKSSRLPIIRLILAGFTMFTILWYKKEKYQKKISTKTLGKLGLTAIAGLTLFYLASNLIGRNTKRDMVDYITMYAGGSIELFDMYLNKPLPKNKIIGYETFCYFINNLNDYGIMKFDKLPSAQLEWRWKNNLNMGNVYTSYRRWYQDFGYIGIIVLQAFMAFFYSYCYQKIKHNNKESILNDMMLIIYAYLAYSLFTHSIDSTFYSFTFRFAFITQMLTILLVYIFFIKTKISFKNGLKITICNHEIINLKEVKHEKISN